MLDGAARLGELFGEAERLDMPALAMTDHGNLFGAFAFYEAARKTSVKPIIGLEAYLTPKTHRSERKRVSFGDGTGDDVSSKGAYTHMTIWSANPEGMHNLFRLSSKSSLEGYFYKPRADRELLNRYSSGLIATTGCPSGEVQTYLRLGQYENALASAAEFRDIFGKENFFVELMDHELSIERRVRGDLLRLAKDLGLPLVATNDLHYTTERDAEAQDTLLCINSGSRKADVGRFKFDGSGYYLKSAEEMRRLFAEVPEACDNTLAIAERIETKFDTGIGQYMPRYDCPAGETEESWFTRSVWEGLRRRYGDTLSDEVIDRAKMEIAVITSMKFSGYFLVVADFINWAKENGIRVGPGRGSGAGSICAYGLRITDLCPIEHGLLFERFLNPDRVSMPDFDIDFDERRRGEVIDYVTRKYGSDKVSQIVTYGSIKAKQAVKDAGRVLDMPFALGEKLTKAMPPAVMGKDLPLKALFDEGHDRYSESGEFRELYENEPGAKLVVDTAMGIEGLKRQWGVHAAGVIMSSHPLEDVIPIMKREQDGAIITQLDYHGCEELGLIKMDFLGLRNLTVMDDAIRNIEANQGITVDLDTLPLDDGPTYELLAAGDTLGVFQLDGGPMRNLLRSLQPDKFEDISAVVALYRPGPMGADSHNKYARRKTGREAIEPIHPELTEALAEILDETYGLIVYQEQVMAIAQTLAGYTLAGADLLRRAMGKKKKSELDAQFEIFSAGMAERGYSTEAMQTVWDILVPFSDYAFNKAHSAAYGLIAYWTAYLKANYPTEYMAALLQSVRSDKDKSALYLAECRHMGIQVLSPDINESNVMFTPVGTDIRFGMGAVRNVGDAVVEAWVEERSRVGKASSFSDFLDKAPLPICNKRVIESLIKAGAFDSMGHSRRQLMEVFESAVDSVISLKRNAENGQDDLFGFGDDDVSAVDIELPDLEEWDRQTRLAFEREMLGLYVSDHPLNGLEHVLAAERDTPIARVIAADGARGQAKIAGLVTSIVRRVNKRGEIWARVTVEDLEASVDVLLFAKQYAAVATYLANDIIISVKGTIVDTADSVEMRGQEVTVPTVDSDGTTGPLTIVLPTARCTPATVEQIKAILLQYPGTTEVRLRLKSPQGEKTFRLDAALKVESGSPLVADLKALLGPSAVTS